MYELTSGFLETAVAISPDPHFRCSSELQVRKHVQETKVV